MNRGTTLCICCSIVAAYNQEDHSNRNPFHRKASFIAFHPSTGISIVQKHRMICPGAHYLHVEMGKKIELEMAALLYHAGTVPLESKQCAEEKGFVARTTLPPTSTLIVTDCNENEENICLITSLSFLKPFWEAVSARKFHIYIFALVLRCSRKRSKTHKPVVTSKTWARISRGQSYKMFSSFCYMPVSLFCRLILVSLLRVWTTLS